LVAGIRGAVELGEEIGVRVQTYSDAVNEDYGEFGGRCMWVRPVSCMFGWGAVRGEKGVGTEGKEGQGAGEGGAVVVEAMIEEFEVGEEIDEADALSC